MWVREEPFRLVALPHGDCQVVDSDVSDDDVLTLVLDLDPVQVGREPLSQLFDFLFNLLLAVWIAVFVLSRLSGESKTKTFFKYCPYYICYPASTLFFLYKKVRFWDEA